VKYNDYTEDLLWRVTTCLTGEIAPGLSPLQYLNTHKGATLNAADAVKDANRLQAVNDVIDAVEKYVCSKAYYDIYVDFFLIL
jgi:hypothetical protein